MADRYLITGGAGFLGINLTRYLLKKGHQVVILDFADFDYHDVQDQVTVIKGDIRDKNKVRRSMENIDIVVHCAAALPLYNKRDILSTDIDGTENILEAAEINGVKRVIHISSTAVYGIPKHHPIMEEDILTGVGAYGMAKIKAEEICLGYRSKGMCVPILRPKSFVGPERLGIFALLYDWAKDGRGFPMIGSGNNRYQLLDVYDLCEAVYLAATVDTKDANNTFNIGAKVFASMKEDYQAVLDEAGFGKKITGFYSAPVIGALRILEALHLSPIYKWIYETASKDSFVSIEKAEALLGYKPRYSNKEALIRNYHWYLENYDQFGETSGISHRKPWKQGILKLVKLFF